MAFTSPTFWLFLYLVGMLAVRLARPADRGWPETYRVPFYPVLPLLFCLSNAFMFYQGARVRDQTTPWGLAASVVVLAIGGGAGVLGRKPRSRRA